MSFTKTLMAACIMSAALNFSPAEAAEEIIIKTDQTQIVKLSGRASTIVVGNPSIVDATIMGDRMFLQGRAFGTSNIIVLDQSGTQLASLEVVVQIGGEHNVAIFSERGRASYVCAPLCEAQMQVGDPLKYTEDLAKVFAVKGELATGQKSAVRE